MRVRIEFPQCLRQATTFFRAGVLAFRATDGARAVGLRRRRCLDWLA